MQYSLAYGREQLTVELPEDNVVKVLKIQSAPALEDPLDAVFDVLEEPTETEPLADIAEGKKSACVVICDGARPVPNPEILPPILQTLENAGIDVPKITILIANGMRRSCSSEERNDLIGEDIMLRKFKVSDHSARKIHQHEYLGVTKSGTPIWIDKRYLEAEVRVLTGVIEPHSIAGFSGGRKSICPGIAAADTVLSCYSPSNFEHEAVRPGNFEDNPIHAEQMEIARKAGCDFVVNVILNEDRKIAKVVGGHLNYAFQEGVAIARKYQTDTVENQVDIVVTSGGGAPFDKTWCQTIQGIIGAADIVKPGGMIIIASACEKGIGSEELEENIEKFPTIEEFMTAVTSESYEEPFIDQWQLHDLAKVLRKAKVKFVSCGITPEVLQKYFVIPCATVEAAVAEALEEYGADATIAVIPMGPRVLALAKNKAIEPEKKVAKKAVKKAATKKTATKKATAKKATVKKAATKKDEEE